MPPHPLPPIPGALRALAPLSPAQRRWLLATDGAVEAGLTPAGLAAAATWAHTEAVSTELLAALVPGAVAVTPPADVPGSALMVDIAHLFVPYASVNGVTIGLVTTTIRFWVYQHSADGPVAVPTGGPHTTSSCGRYASPLPTAPRSIDLGRFLLNEATGELYYRVRLAGALSIKRVSPNRARGLGARTRTFSLFEPSPAAAAEGLPGVSVSHVVIEDTPLLSRGPGGRLRIGSGGGQGVYGDWRNRPLTSVIDFTGFAAALGRMAGRRNGRRRRRLRASRHRPRPRRCWQPSRRQSQPPGQGLRQRQQQRGRRRPIPRRHAPSRQSAWRPASVAAGGTLSGLPLAQGGLLPRRAHQGRWKTHPPPWRTGRRWSPPPPPPPPALRPPRTGMLRVRAMVVTAIHTGALVTGATAPMPPPPRPRGPRSRALLLL